MASHATAYEVSAADVDAAEGTLSRLWWISIAARVFPLLATTSKAKREREAGRLRLNGNAAAATNTTVAVGDCITYEPDDGVHSTLSGYTQEGEEDGGRVQSADRWCAVCQRQGLRIVFEGDAFAVVVKPVGIHVKGRGWRTVEYALQALLHPCPPHVPDALRTAHAVHRLDYRVGGLLLVAKTRSAEVSLAGQFESHRVVKKYRAILTGRLDPSTTTALSQTLPIQLSQTLHTPMQSKSVFFMDSPLDGKRCCTAVAVHSITPSARYGWITTVDLWPLTGRWHQLRLHMASLGHPIVGDDLHHHGGSSERDGGGDARVVRGAGLFLAAVAISFDDSHGSRRSLAIKEPHKFGRFRHFCALNRQKEIDREARTTLVPPH